MEETGITKKKQVNLIDLIDPDKITTDSECSITLIQNNRLPEICSTKVFRALSELKELKEQTGCESERCVIEKRICDTKDCSLLKNYKGTGPTNTEWLSNFDIDDKLLSKLEIHHPEYLHVSYQMRDFKDAGILYKLNLCKIINDGLKKKIGVVMNTDYSFGNGLHWYAILIDLTNKPVTIEYFNSTGDRPLLETQVWMEWCVKELEKCQYDSKIVLVRKDEEIQKDDHSCGVWSTYYILNRVLGVTIEQFEKSRKLNDHTMHKMRKLLFTSK